MKIFATVPDITPFAESWFKWDGKTWLVTERMIVDFEFKGACFRLTVSPGFTTDGGSIPRFFWRVMGHPLGAYLLAYIIHDALYSAEYFSRRECDEIFLEILAELKACRMIRSAAYATVRLGGYFVWKWHTAESVANARKLISLEEEHF